MQGCDICNKKIQLRNSGGNRSRNIFAYKGCRAMKNVEKLCSMLLPSHLTAAFDFMFLRSNPGRTLSGILSLEISI